MKPHDGIDKVKLEALPLNRLKEKRIAKREIDIDIDEKQNNVIKLKPIVL